MTNEPHNPPPGEPHRTDSPLTQLIVSMSGASGGEHETEPPGADTRSVTAGHEPDMFGIKGILMVPAFVAAVLVVAYLIVSGIFFGINETPGRVNDNPQAEALNITADGDERPINERFARLSSTEPKNLPDQPATAVPQPRLEGLKLTADKAEGSDPPYYRSKLATSDGNSPELHPEDLRPDRYIGRFGDPVVGRPFLGAYGWADEGKRVARIPIDDAIREIVRGKKLPVRKDAAPVERTSEEKAKMSNSGRGGPSGFATVSTTPAPRE